MRASGASACLATSRHANVFWFATNFAATWGVKFRFEYHRCLHTFALGVEIYTQALVANQFSFIYLFFHIQRRVQGSEPARHRLHPEQIYKHMNPNLCRAHMLEPDRYEAHPLLNANGVFLARGCAVFLPRTRSEGSKHCKVAGSETLTMASVRWGTRRGD